MSDFAPDIAATMSAWVHGWTHSRGTLRPQVRDFGFSVQVHGYGESVRRVLPNPTPEQLGAVISESTEPKACIKFPGDPARWLTHFPTGWVPQDEQWLMTAPLPDLPQMLPPPGYTISTTQQPGRVSVTVLDASGVTAAAGQAGIADSVAVPDQISTELDHRRRGLGAVVMRALERLAGDQSATRQVLVATPDGRGLYSSLGWTLLGPVTAARLG